MSIFAAINWLAKGNNSRDKAQNAQKQ